jgi:glycosyltransferase involved in cell wall biosynthesis
VNQIARPERPRVLVVSDWYLPGQTGGGIVRSLVNLVDWLGDEFEFLVVTRDREPGDSGPFPGVRSGTWQAVGKARVFYRPPRRVELRFWRRLLATTPHDVVYLNSCFSSSVVQILLLRRLGMVPIRSTILAPRGVLAPGALGLKWAKKAAYLGLSKWLGLHRNITWHATGEDEERHVLQQFRAALATNGQTRHGGRGRWDASKVVIAPNLPPAPKPESSHCPRPIKRPGSASVVFVGRVSRVKNLDVALATLSSVRGTVKLDIYGPIEDGQYWRECQEQAERLPGNVRVEYRGVVSFDQVACLMNGHDLLFLPTRGENFGHSILEALSSGCPVLISDKTPWSGVTSRRAGWAIALDDRRKFEAALQRLVDMDEPEFAAFSNAAREFAREFVEKPGLLEATRGLFLPSGRQPPAREGNEDI